MSTRTNSRSNSGGSRSGWTRREPSDSDPIIDQPEWVPPPREWKAPPLHQVESWGPGPFWDEVREYLIWPCGFDDSYFSSKGYRRRTAIFAGKPWEKNGPRPRAMSLDNFGLRMRSPFPSRDIIQYALGPQIFALLAPDRQQLLLKSQTVAPPRNVIRESSFDSNPGLNYSYFWEERIGAWVRKRHRPALEPYPTPTNENATSSPPVGHKDKEKCEEPFKAHRSLSQPMSQITINDLITNLYDHNLQITGHPKCPCEVDRWHHQRQRENACCCLCHLGEGVRSAPSWRDRSYTHHCELYVRWVELRDRYDSMPCKCLLGDGDYIGVFGTHHDGGKAAGSWSSHVDFSSDGIASRVGSGNDPECQDDTNSRGFKHTSEGVPSRIAASAHPFPVDDVPEFMLSEDQIAEEMGMETLQHSSPVVSRAATPPEPANGDANESASSSVVIPTTNAHAHQINRNNLVSGYVLWPLSVAWNNARTTMAPKIVPVILPHPVVSVLLQGFEFAFSCLHDPSAMPSRIGNKINEAILACEYQLRLRLLEWKHQRKISKEKASKKAALDKAIAHEYSTAAALREEYLAFINASETSKEVQELTDLDELILWIFLLQIYTALLVSFVTTLAIILTSLESGVAAPSEAIRE